MTRNKDDNAGKKANKKDPYDHTSSKRADEYLTRLQESKGRRLPVDLDGERNAKLKALQDSGYAKSAVDVMRKALDEAHERMVDSRKNDS